MPDKYKTHRELQDRQGIYKSHKTGELTMKSKNHDKHFGVNPKNNQWEYMGKNFTHPDYKKSKAKALAKHKE